MHDSASDGIKGVTEPGLTMQGDGRSGAKRFQEALLETDIYHVHSKSRVWPILDLLKPSSFSDERKVDHVYSIIGQRFALLAGRMSEIGTR